MHVGEMKMKKAKPMLNIYANTNIHKNNTTARENLNPANPTCTNVFTNSQTN